MMMVETRAVTLSVERERRAPPALAGGSRSWPPINRRGADTCRRQHGALRASNIRRLAEVESEYVSRSGSSNLASALAPQLAN